MPERIFWWRVKDFADGWIYFQQEHGARAEARETDALLQRWNNLSGKWDDVK